MLTTVSDHAIDQFLTGRNIVDEAYNLTGGNHASISVATFKRRPTASAGDEMFNVFEHGAFRTIFNSDNFFRHRVAKYSRGVVQLSKHQARVALRRIDERLFDVRMNRRFLSRAEARAHVDALCAKRERCRHAAAVTDASGSDDRNLEFFDRGGNQNESADIVLARMTCAFEAVD